MANSTEVSILHGFEFPTYCTDLEISLDNKTLLAVGGYKPCISLFDLREHTQKLERHSDDELIKGTFLGEDWTKIALLHSSGKIEFQSQFGKHETVNLPQQCRDIKADRINANILSAGKAGDVYVFSTEAGKFCPTIKTKVESSEEIAINTTNTLYAVAGSTSENAGVCEFIDRRCNEMVNSLALDTSATSCTFSEDGLIFAVGTEGGLISVYDMRSPVPLIEKDHNYDFRIKKVQIKNKNVISLDKKGVKVWERATGKVLAAVQPSFDANSFAVSEGILFLGGTAAEMKTYYVPSLGSIPKWCSNLEGATEEMDEMQKMTYYDQYRFITEEELVELNLQKEVGKQIKPHMHGYLIPHTLYNKHENKMEEKK
ncbi:ribosome biogenesis protein ENP2 [Nematocida minor]|uniref:ribosome biogenesis protein ENP2 n=1 Tax=Nematocida minor TaxID=1912983 RepID=UPI00221E9EEF|nr:ribosome biogenesis protein ENP2 [Nematocida minor]KAI5191527.1 ribosome biogenesis protein ENP2 [Nematocida minor]